MYCECDDVLSSSTDELVQVQGVVEWHTEAAVAEGEAGLAAGLGWMTGLTDIAVVVLV